MASSLLLSVLVTSCIDEPEFRVVQTREDGADEASDAAGSTPIGAEAGSYAAYESDGSSSTTPPPPSSPPPNDDSDGGGNGANGNGNGKGKNGDDDGTFCGTVFCIGCANRESADCRDCERACSVSQLCCKRGGPPRCTTLDKGC